MSHSSPKPAHLRPWAGLSPLAAKRRRLDGLGAEGPRRRNDDHVAPPAPSLATQPLRADGSTAAEDQNHGGKDVAPAPPLQPLAFAPAPTPTPVTAPAPPPLPPLTATPLRRMMPAPAPPLQSMAPAPAPTPTPTPAPPVTAPAPPPLPPPTATPSQRMTSPRRLVSPLRRSLWPPSHDSEPQQLNSGDAVGEGEASLTTQRHWLDSSGAEDEDRPTTQRRRLILRPPRPPPPARLHHDAEPCQPGSGSDNGRASSLGDIDAAFQHCLRMSPLDQAEAAFLPKPSPGLQVPLPLLTGSTPSALAGPELLPPTGADLSAGMQASLAALEAESQAARLAHAKQEQSDKSTAGTYQRHINRYEAWWEGFQEEKMKTIPGWTMIPAFPITAAKVGMFLGYESTREKVCPPFSPRPSLC